MHCAPFLNEAAGKDKNINFFVCFSVKYKDVETLTYNGHYWLIKEISWFILNKGLLANVHF